MTLYSQFGQILVVVFYRSAAIKWFKIVHNKTDKNYLRTVNYGDTSDTFDIGPVFV